MSSMTSQDAIYSSEWLEEELKQLWWIGAIIYVVGSVLINLGSNLIRKDHSIEDTKTKKTSPYKRPIWLLGFGIFGFGNVLNFVAFMFAAQSLLAALGSVQFVTNIFFAGAINKEPVTTRAVVATCIIIVGNIFIVLFGSKTTQNYNLDELKDLALDPLFLGYLLTILIIVAVLQCIFWYFQYRIDQYPDTHQAPTGMLKYQPFAYATVSAIIGTNTIIFGKICAGLLQNAFKGEDIFTSIWTYGIIFAFAITMVFWLYRMNNALRMYDAMFIIPVLQCVWLLFGVLGGEVFFKEYEDMTDPEALMFTVGVVILLLGISTLRPSNKATTNNDMDVEMDELEDDNDEEKQENRSQSSEENIEETFELGEESLELNNTSTRSKNIVK